ncbi:MAG: hypothetical protein KBT88_10270 [Gammaproteobacteria bacterium]|nr:hypothetical protein [Gammaproteobacteria bacterium]MBQ0840159.1 hypothetical protein [Gammaproteobacteria bacterium]
MTTTKKLITTSTLATALLLGGVNYPQVNSFPAQTALYDSGVYETVLDKVHHTVLAQPALFAANGLGFPGLEQRFSIEQVLGKKGIQYRHFEQSDKPDRAYQYNKPRKSHRPAKTDRGYRSDEAAAPVPSRKIGSGARFVSLVMSQYESSQIA